MTAREARIAKLVKALAFELDTHLRAGAHVADDVLVDGLVVKLELTARHAVTRDQTRMHVESALVKLHASPGLVRQCGCYVKGPAWTKLTYHCSGRVSAAVVYQTRHSEGSHLLFVCPRHKTAHHIDAKTVLAVVDLPKDHLKLIHVQAEREQAEWRRKDEEEQRQWETKEKEAT